MHDIPHDIFHIDKGFSCTFLNLLKKPSITLAKYIEGKRIRYFKPFAYVIIMSAISTFIGHFIEKIMAFISTKRGLQNVEIYHVQSFFSKYQSAFIFLMIPIATLINWLIFRKNKYNYWEHILMNTYMAAQLNILIIITQMVMLIRWLAAGYKNYNLTLFITGFMAY